MLPIVTIYPSYIPTISQLSLPIPNGLVCQYHPAILGGSIHAAPRKRWGPLVVLCWATSNSWTSLIYIYIYIRLYYYIYNIYILIMCVCFFTIPKAQQASYWTKTKLSHKSFPTQSAWIPWVLLLKPWTITQSSWPSFTQACHRAANALSQLNGLDGDQMGSIHGENEDFRKQNGGFHGIYTAWWCNNMQ